MAISSSISASELARILQAQYVGQTFEVALVNSGSASYNPETTIDSEFLQFEVSEGVGGYQRQVISFEQTDVAPYSDKGLGLATKVAKFTHDGSAQTINFSHVVLVRGQGNIWGLAEDPSGLPTIVEDNNEVMTAGFYRALPTLSTGTGRGATLDIEVFGFGDEPDDYVITLNNRGRGYEAGDSIEVTGATLVAAGAAPIDLGSITILVTEVQEDGGTIVSASATATPVILGNGNEAVFYFNNKIFGFADADS